MGKKTLQNSAHTQTQKSARENMRKESTEQAQILETIDNKEFFLTEEKMKQVINHNKYENTEQKKPVKDVKEQSTNDQKVPEVTMTKQNDTNITTTPKETSKKPYNRQKTGCSKTRTIKE